ncbi:MAG: hypothetical protein MUE40_11840 [Anaerolineae bacterium]|nr:hypothetical protein [Anaerolineae bacterium]
MSFRSALNALAALNVNGIARNLAIEATPEAPQRGQLPALLILPIDFHEERRAQEQSHGFEALAFSSAGQTVSYCVTHLLLIAPAAQGRGIRDHLPLLVDSIDAYFSALGANVTLGGALLEPARVRVEPGSFTLGGVAYYGCAFRHTWLIQM